MTSVLKRIPRQWHRTIATNKSTGFNLPLAYEIYKPQTNMKSEAVIILHGLFGSKKNNRGISKVLARDLGRPVYAIDLRNHGDSPHNQKHDYLSMAEDLFWFISMHGLKNPTLIGHSMGAKAAMALALQYPSLIQDIVSVDNAPANTMFPSDFSRYIEGMQKVEAAKVQKQSEADEILQGYVESLPVRQFLLGNLYRTEDKSQRFKIPLEILNRSLTTLRNFPIQELESHKFKKPSLFVRGTKSNFIPDHLLPGIEKFFPQYKLVGIEAGHWVISDSPDEFRKAVIQFLSREEQVE
ncbi:Abhydrolase domain-containing protein C22H12.03 [Golovinomyces cichoracearum]|uniref:Abhydrolase domain-containing protein C22H12.03 n=1 Tax=Golovinomyces cichoracearum TaxID=62708 RepID=A0A420I8B3_9PEZI|nr:Abhydrolase domain-containing protein C22H12.03 [Golovinomyces cichoracearum]